MNYIISSHQVRLISILDNKDTSIDSKYDDDLDDIPTADIGRNSRAHPIHKPRSENQMISTNEMRIKLRNDSRIKECRILSCVPLRHSFTFFEFMNIFMEHANWKIFEDLGTPIYIVIIICKKFFFIIYQIVTIIGIVTDPRRILKKLILLIY